MDPPTAIRSSRPTEKPLSDSLKSKEVADGADLPKGCIEFLHLSRGGAPLEVWRSSMAAHAR